MNTEGGNPAFPIDGTLRGLTKREYFAAHAPTPRDQMPLDEHVAYRYRYADAMLGIAEAPTKAMCRAAVEYVNGPDVYKTLPAEVLEIEESMYCEIWKAMQRA